VPSPIQIGSLQAEKGAVMELETTTAVAFSYFGTDKMIIRPESERFVPVFLSLRRLQSNQMLICH